MSQIELLTARDLSFAYDGRPVLKGVSLSIESKEFVGLIGPNGSGKTTLLRLLLGFLRGSGDVALGGAPLSSLSRADIAKFATIVQQDTRVDFAFTAREIVAMGRTPYLGRFNHEGPKDREAISRAMQQTDTAIFNERSVMELSGGERQRVHLARALAQETKVILLDEPTANLDLTHQFEALQLVREFTRAGGGAIAAIHDLSLAARFCDRLVLLSSGHIVATGKPEEVVTEDNLLRYFGLLARIRRDDETGGLFVHPIGTDGPKLMERTVGANN